jgi:hypothetical protein
MVRSKPQANLFRFSLPASRLIAVLVSVIALPDVERSSGSAGYTTTLTGFSQGSKFASAISPSEKASAHRATL